MKHFKFILFLQLLVGCVFADVVEFKRIPANIGKSALVVELAKSDTERQLGLMHRQELGENAGMLFVFEDEAPRSFWMKNTLIPLSIAFLNSNRTIVDIQDMEPMPKSANAPIPTYPSRKPAMFALEVNKGWFKKHNVQVGQRLDVTLTK